MVIDSATASGPGGRPAAVTASSRTVGEDEDAGTGLSLVIDGVRHLQITTRPVPALKRPAQTLASRLCSDPVAGQAVGGRDGHRRLLLGDSAPCVDAGGRGTDQRPGRAQAAARDPARGGMQDGHVRRPVTGAAQGGVISPLLCNAYLHRIDRVWSAREHGVLVRFADDVLVMCRSREQAEAARQRLRSLLAELGRAPKEAKTRIVHLRVDGEGFDFLGFHHRLVRSRPRDGRRPVEFLARWPSDKAMQHARNRIRELTDRHRLLLDAETVVRDVNAFPRGWAGYFRYGHSAQHLRKIRYYVRMRIALFRSKRHRRSRSFGWWALLNFTPNDFGLIGLYGIVVSPRAGKPWRDKPNTAGERRR